jgi:hypothetical protein
MGLFTWAFVPETKGVPIEAIEDKLIKRHWFWGKVGVGGSAGFRVEQPRGGATAARRVDCRAGDCGAAGRLQGGRVTAWRRGDCGAARGLQGGENAGQQHVDCMLNRAVACRLSVPPIQIMRPVYRAEEEEDAQHPITYELSAVPPKQP